MRWTIITPDRRQQMAEKKKLLYVLFTGVNSPHRVYQPFLLSIAAKAMDLDATIYFRSAGVVVVKKGEAEKLQVEPYPVLKELMNQAIAAGVKFMACEQSARGFGVGQGDLLPEVELVGAATLNLQVLEADGSLWF
jgi:predicted peroxiredoxin